MFDICVAGGGMVGSAVALGLGKMGFKVAMIEPCKPQEYSPEQLPDMRVSAISLNSERLLTELGGWSHAKNMRTCPYKRLSVWDNSSCRTDFNCSDLEVPHLGHIVENRVIQLGLHEAIEDNANISSFWQNISRIDLSHTPSIRLNNGDIIQAKFLVGADGANSIVRKTANIGVKGWEYNQHALGIKIRTYSVQQDITWQQFTPDGPVAFLPLFEGFGSLVWYHSAEKIKFLKGLSKKKLKQHIIQSFPRELVDFDVLEEASFPLARMHANQYYSDRSVLVGDAAHTINPLAGQGVNLGFKDVAELLKVISESLAESDHNQVLNKAMREKWLSEYEVKRRRDNLTMMTTMDALYSIFSNDNVPLKFIRNLGLKIAHHSGPVKSLAMKYAMGIA